MKKFLIAAPVVLLLTAAGFSLDQPASEASSYTIRVVAADEGAHPVVKVLKLEVEGEDARPFTQKAAPFEIEIEAQDFEAKFQVVPGGQSIKVELLREESSEGEDIVLSATSDGHVTLRYHEGSGGEISAGNDAE